jgi:hypothetical protein
MTTKTIRNKKNKSALIFDLFFSLIALARLKPFQEKLTIATIIKK